MLRRDSGPTGSLFERIREAANPPSYQNPKEALIRSIRRNLRQVLNTLRQLLWFTGAGDY